MMTEQEFLELSESLDENEPLNGEELNEDGKLLLELRQSLREERDAPTLLEDDMASRVRKAHAAIPLSIRRTIRLQNILRKSVGSRVGVLGGLMTFAVGTGLFVLSGDLSVIVGAVFFLVAIGWLSSDWRNPTLELPGVHALGFYVLPVLAVALTAAMAGLAVDGLDAVSVTFQKDRDALNIMGWASAIGIFSLLTLALAPSWRALRDNYGKHKWHLLIHTICYGIWSSLCLVAAAGMIHSGPQAEKRVVMAMIVWTTVSFALAYLAPYTPSGHLDLRAARGRSRKSLVLSLLPIGICVYAFYQAHLTRELHHEKRYQTVQAEVDAWYQRQMKIPNEQNGWFDVKHFLLITEINAGRDEEIGVRLSGLNEYYDKKKPAEGAEWAKAKVDFLTELPRLEKALEKPYFSHLPTTAQNGLRIENLVPYYRTMISVSRGLTELTREALRLDQPQVALGYTQTGLKWATKPEIGTLIGLSIKRAMTEIALESVEDLILSEKLNETQLRELGQSLDDSRLSERTLIDGMFREIYVIDKVMQEMKAASFDEITDYGELYETQSAQLIAMLMPASYIESERLAYLNFQLARIDQWEQLSASNLDQIEQQLNPLNLASRLFVPNTVRTQVELAYTHSKHDAYRVKVALELYRLETGEYPKSLEPLVPNYLKEVPRDMMHEAVMKRKAVFGYKKTRDGYELVSESSSYEFLDKENRQVYKPK
jgi:hypothetical protein